MLLLDHLLDRVHSSKDFECHILNQFSDKYFQLNLLNRNRRNRTSALSNLLKSNRFEIVQHQMNKHVGWNNSLIKVRMWRNNEKNAKIDERIFTWNIKCPWSLFNIRSFNRKYSVRVYRRVDTFFNASPPIIVLMKNKSHAIVITPLSCNDSDTISHINYECFTNKLRTNSFTLKTNRNC